MENFQGLTDLPTTKKQIDSIIDDFCKLRTESAVKIGPEYQSLWLQISHYFARGGKRLRPYLFVLAYESFGGTNTASVMKAAAAWELLHGCLLIHDDIIDRDDIRHGHLNISGIYKKTHDGHPDGDHLAMSSALLAGDLALSGAYQMIAESELSLDAKQYMNQTISDAVYIVAGGELLDFQAVTRSISSVNTDAIAEHKTASYSFVAPLISGAGLAGADSENLTSLRQLGLKLGTAYQLSDDLLGMFGNTEETGKSIDSDIREGKRTKLIQTTYDRLNTVEQAELTELLGQGRTMPTKNIIRIKTLVKDSGAVDYIREQISDHINEADDIIDSFGLTSDAKKAFKDLTVKLRTRLS